MCPVVGGLVLGLLLWLVYFEHHMTPRPNLTRCLTQACGLCSGSWTLSHDSSFCLFFCWTTVGTGGIRELELLRALTTGARACLGAVIDEGRLHQALGERAAAWLLAAVRSHVNYLALQSLEGELVQSLTLGLPTMSHSAGLWWDEKPVCEA